MPQLCVRAAQAVQAPASNRPCDESARESAFHCVLLASHSLGVSVIPFRVPVSVGSGISTGHCSSCTVRYSPGTGAGAAICMPSQQHQHGLNVLKTKSTCAARHPVCAASNCSSPSLSGWLTKGRDGGRPRTRRGKLSHARVCRHFYSFSSSVSATRHATADGGRPRTRRADSGREAGRALIAGRLCMCGWRAARPGPYEQRA